MAAPEPFQVKEHFQLTDLGISIENINHHTITMQSGKYICVREFVNNSIQVVIIETDNPEQVVRKRVCAISTYMNPNEKILALRSKRSLVIFDIERKFVIKEYKMREKVVFWKWISWDVLCLVTEKVVYHYSIVENMDPIKVFKRHSALEGYHIVNYKANREQNWLLLIAASINDNHMMGIIQLYSVKKRKMDLIYGHTASFAEFQMEVNVKPSLLLCLSVNNENGSQLIIREIDKPRSNQPFPMKVIKITYPPIPFYDSIIDLHISTKYKFIFLVSSFGFIFVYDMDSGQRLCIKRISKEFFFPSASFETTGTIVGVNSKGKVLSLTINENNVIPYVRSVNPDPEVAIGLALRYGFTGAKDLLIRKFESLFKDGQYIKAAKLAVRAPGEELRTPETIRKLKMVPTVQGMAPHLVHYFAMITDLHKLNMCESKEVIFLVSNQQSHPWLKKWILEDKIQFCERFGDMVRKKNRILACFIYMKAKAHDKAIEGLADFGMFKELIEYARKNDYYPDYKALLRKIMRKNLRASIQFGRELVCNRWPVCTVSHFAKLFMEELTALQEESTRTLNSSK